MRRPNERVLAGFWTLAHLIGGVAAGGSDSILPHYVFGNTTINYTYASLMFTAIVVVSILLEHLMVKLDHAAEDQPHYAEMVKKVYGELTILGIISFALTLAQEIMREASGASTIDDTILVAFELAHLLIFIVAMVYVGTGLVAVRALRQTKIRWDTVQFETVEAIVNGGDRLKIQCKIFQLLMMHQYGLGFYFDFARYSYLVMSENVGSMLEIDALTWIILLACNLVFLFGRYVSGANCEWSYVYHGGDPCSSSWETGSNVSQDDDVPPTYGSLGDSTEELQETLLRFSAWPVVTLICFGWLLMALMIFGILLTKRRRSNLIHAAAIRLKAETDGLKEIDINRLKHRHAAHRDYKPFLTALGEVCEQEKQTILQELREHEKANRFGHDDHASHAYKPKSTTTTSGRDVIPEWYLQNPRSEVLPSEKDAARISQAKASLADPCPWISNSSIQKTMEISQYLLCNYIGIYILCMTFGRSQAGRNVINQSFQSAGIQVLVHVLYLFPFVISTLVFFPHVTRDTSLLEGILELNHEAVHAVEEIEHQVLEIRVSLIKAIHKCVHSNTMMGLTVRRQLDELGAKSVDRLLPIEEAEGDAEEVEDADEDIMQYHAAADVHIDHWPHKEAVVGLLYDLWASDVTTRPDNVGCRSSTGRTNPKALFACSDRSNHALGRPGIVSRYELVRHLKGINFRLSDLKLRRLLRVLDPEHLDKISKQQWLDFFSVSARDLQGGQNPIFLKHHARHPHQHRRATYARP